MVYDWVEQMVVQLVEELVVQLAVGTVEKWGLSKVVMSVGATVVQ